MASNESTNKIASLKRVDSHQNIAALLLDEEMADITFVFRSDDNEIRIRAHKLILAKDSPVFKAMFVGDWKEKDEVVVVDVPAAAFNDFLRAIYGEVVNLSIENIADVTYLADKYQVKICLQICDTFLEEHLPIEEICLAYELAIKHNRHELRMKLGQKIGEQSKAVLSSNRFRECSRDVLHNVLELEQLSCNAVEVFEACMAWARTACSKNGLDPTDDNIKFQLDECFYMIPFYLMHSQQVSQIVHQHEGLFAKKELIELFRLAATDGPIKLEIFKYNKTFSSTKWKEDFDGYDWQWFWNQGYYDNRRWLKEHESDKFFTSRVCLMVAIKLSVIMHNGSTGTKPLSGVLSIIEEDDKEEGYTFIEPFEFSGETVLKQQIDILCHFQNSNQTQVLKLHKPILCSPEKIYIMHFDFDSSWSDETFFIPKLASSAKICQYIHTGDF